MDMPRRFPCPVCKGEGFVWESKVKGAELIHTWHVFECYLCDGNKRVLVDKDGWLTGPDASPRYFNKDGTLVRN